MKKLRLVKTFSMVLFGLAIASPSWAGRILLTEFIGSAGYAQIKANLEADGHSVDIVDSTTGGSLAAALAAASYDQVFLWDLTQNLSLNVLDTNALASFWGMHSGLVVDTRSYGYHFQGTNASEQALMRNVATNLDLSGGGVWVGTDHAPQWTNNGNAFLNAIGVNTITGSFGNPVNFADPTSVLLSDVTPTELWGGGQTVGSAPIGIQPNGTEMFIHFGNQDNNILPYISASFDLQGVEPPPPTSVPEPSTLALMGLVLLGMASRRKAKSY